MPKVAVFGGGIGGLTVAHELTTRGFEVDVYEKNEICGGKARSLEKPGTGTGPRRDLPGEHGFRFFPGFYQHLDDMMKRIPVGNGNSAYDNLVDAKTFAIAQEGQQLYNLPTDTPTTLPGWIVALDNFFGNPELGLAPGESQILLNRILRLLSMCRERRKKDYECTSWSDYHNDPIQRSDQYNKMFVTGFSRAFVAMDAEKASTWTGANILSQFFKVFFETGTIDRVLNGPTNDVWLSPWVTWLQGEGVNFHMKEKLTALTVSTGASPSTITSAAVEHTETNAMTTVTADYYVAAVPVEVMTPLVESNPALVAAAPSLDKIGDLEVSWMNGIVFYLKNEVPVVGGHINFADSKWALTGISQAQFWNDSPTGFGDGSIKGILSIVISDWTTAGDKVHLKTGAQCDSPEEVAEETWAQILPHLPSTVASSLTSQDPVDFFLDPAITFHSLLFPLRPGMDEILAGLPRGFLSARDFGVLTLDLIRARNAEPLLINTACSLVHRPNAATEVGNLMLASDYVKTNVDLATMEGANEAGRRAANAILAASNSNQLLCDVWEYEEPDVFTEAQALDRALFEAGLPYYGDFLLP